MHAYGIFWMNFIINFLIGWNISAVNLHSMLCNDGKFTFCAKPQFRRTSEINMSTLEWRRQFNELRKLLWKMIPTKQRNNIES